LLIPLYGLRLIRDSGPRRFRSERLRVVGELIAPLLGATKGFFGDVTGAAGDGSRGPSGVRIAGHSAKSFGKLAPPLPGDFGDVVSKSRGRPPSAQRRAPTPG
jgi:hypothetical protein